jgi:hypothetical protein
MNKVRSAAIAIAALGLAACATAPMSGSGGVAAVTPNPDCPLLSAVPVASRPCNLANCPLWVQVITNPTDGKCEVIVEANVLQLEKGYHGPTGTGVTINWWLPRSTATQWEFRAESAYYTLPVNFKDQNAPQLRVQFSPAVVLPSKGQVDVRDQNTNKYDYGYKIRLFKVGGGATDWIESRDPTIMNDN